jgi:hypothetical protein
MRRIILVERDVLGLDRQRAPVGHGVPGVDREVDDGIVDLSRIDDRGP